MKKSMALFLIVFVNIFFTQESVHEKLANSAVALISQRVTYDPTYFRIGYPNGDVPSNKGVCTDVVVRAYRKIGIDLQQLVHEDMQKNFELYPKLWGLSKTDTNIDHRRVPNLTKFFSRFGTILKTERKPDLYKPGDIVTWSLGGGLTHIGIVINKKSNDGLRPLIVHNIGQGQEISDCLFTYAITGHYRYPSH